ncbi:MAG: restriction endonuclease subunit S [Thiobacillus sp.]|nr:restriction endonuclease subunit S [Thiobacillus sp.]
MKVQESLPAYEVLAQSVSTDNWTLVPLKELGRWSGGGTPSKSKLDYWEDGTIPWVSPKDMKTDHIVDSEDHVTQAAVEESTAKLIPAGSVLIVTRSGILSHTLPVSMTTVPVTVNQDLKALTPREGVLPEYVAWALRCFAREILNTCSKQGTTVSSIETAALHRFKIPVAPLDQQKRIVAEIEKQFSRLDEAVANLKRVKANLKRYKAAVLKAAVEGRLVETEAELARREGRSYETGAQLLQRIFETRRSKWQGKGKYKEPAVPDTTELPVLPEGWVWASFDQACEAVSDEGKKIARSEYLADGVLPVIDQGESDIGGYTDKSELSYTGQLPVIAFGDHTRRFKLVFVPFVVGADGVKLIGIGPAWIPRFLWFQFQTLNFEDRGYSRHFQFVRNKPLRMPPLTEQLRIVTEVDRSLSIIRKTEVQVAANLQRAQRMRQAILAKAFACA